MLNDTPVACQIREPTDPQGDRWHGEAVTDEVSPPQRLRIAFPLGFYAALNDRPPLAFPLGVRGVE